MSQRPQTVRTKAPPGRKRRWLWLLSCSLVAGLVAAITLLREAHPRVVSSASSAAYADERTCVSCHAAAAAGYARTGMAHSFSRAGDQDRALAAQPPYIHRASQTTFAFVLENGELTQRRSQMGPTGQPENIENLHVDYVMGSGNHARTYLHQDSDGTLIELPLAWYAEGGGTTAMNPGFDNPHPPTRRLITYECMFCHNGYPAVPDTAHADNQATPVYVGELPHGITCQRCHGPGQQHVDSALATGTSLEKVRAAIVNPARLAHEQQMQVCEQCHLQITSQPLPDRIRHFDRGPFDYRAGEPLDTAIDYFTRNPSIAAPTNFEIVSAPYRLRQSKCFRESGGAVTCQSCHNPHNLQKGPAAAAYFANICLNCHREQLASKIAAGAHPVATECTSCHMPLRRTEDVVHVTMHDHLIQRPSRSQKDLLQPLTETEQTLSNSYRGEVQPYPGHFDSGRPEAQMYLAAAQILQDSNSTAGMLKLEGLLQSRPAHEAEFDLALGDAKTRAGNNLAAVAAYRRAYASDPLSEPATRSLAVALSITGDTAEALRILQAALTRSPGSALLAYEKGRIELIAGNTSAGREDLRHALLLKPGFAQANNDLGLSLAQTGELEAAESALRASLAANPFEASTLSNLANVLASRGNFRDAAFYLDKAVRLAPASVSAHLAYAAVLAQVRRFPAALVQARSAQTLDPNSCMVRSQLAEILAQTGALPGAEKELNVCLTRDPGDSRANLDLALVELARKQTLAALEHLNTAAHGSNPDIAIQARVVLMKIQAR